ELVNDSSSGQVVQIFGAINFSDVPCSSIWQYDAALTGIKKVTQQLRDFSDVLEIGCMDETSGWFDKRPYHYFCSSSDSSF
ncbi:MAG: hypothetical protein KA247_05220, partial [Bacteroidetes bacterium]|nr:hypothetical protein [Bacteroidota bacterium]